MPSPNPAGMIFIPFKNGISHNEIADAKLAHIEADCNVSLQATLERRRPVGVDLDAIAALWHRELKDLRNLQR